MSKKNKDNVNDAVKEEKVKKVVKKKKSSFEKRKVIMKIFGVIMALIMILGTLLSIFSMLFL